MFASLLAASLASNLGLVGCTLTDWLMNDGFAIPSGSRSSARPFCGPDDAECSGDSTADVDCASG